MLNYLTATPIIRGQLASSMLIARLCGYVKEMVEVARYVLCYDCIALYNIQGDK